MCRTIGADRVFVVAHVDEDMWMIEGRQGPHAHEFLHADADLRDTRLIVEMWRCVLGHCDFRCHRSDANLIRWAPAHGEARRCGGLEHDGGLEVQRLLPQGLTRLAD
jgi:hypothetical protein